MTDTQEMTNPPESRICHECGTEIPAGAKECSRCALEAELKAKGFEVDLEALAAELPQLEILEELGRGGMGVVFKGRQKSLGRDVAVKVLPKELDYDPSFSDRFLRECRTLAGLSHPNVVTVYDAGVAAGHNYLLMELVDGTDLAKLMRSGDVQPDQALSIVSQICEALQYAHDQGVVHRDIKPGNILLDREGHVKLGDFGLAKLLRSDESMRLTGTMQAMGTPQYMAPEQLERPLEVDHRADLYSLGVVLYELLTGELPLGRFEEPSKRADVDVGLDEVVMKTLEKEPDQRYQSASEVRVEVQRASDAARGDGRGRRREIVIFGAGRSSKYGARHYLGCGLLLTALVWVPLLIVAVFIFPSTKELLVFFIGAPVLVGLLGLVGWGIRRLTRERSVAYRLGVVLLVFAVLVCLGASLLMISAGGRVFVLIPLACAVVAAFLIGGLVILRGKKDRPVQRRETRQEERVSTASYVTRGSGEGEGEAEAEPTSPGNQASPSEGLTEEHGADGDGRSGMKKVEVSIGSAKISTSGCLAILGGLFLGLWLFGLLPEIRLSSLMSQTSEADEHWIEESIYAVRPVVAGIAQGRSQDWDWDVERHDAWNAKAREVFNFVGDRFALSPWWIDDLELSAKEASELEEKLRSVRKRWERTLIAHTDVKVLANGRVVGTLKPFEEVPWAEINAVCEAALSSTLGKEWRSRNVSGEPIEFFRGVFGNVKGEFTFRRLSVPSEMNEESGLGVINEGTIERIMGSAMQSMVEVDAERLLTDEKYTYDLRILYDMKWDRPSAKEARLAEGAPEDRVDYWLDNDMRVILAHALGAEIEETVVKSLTPEEIRAKRAEGAAEWARDNEVRERGEGAQQMAHHTLSVFAVSVDEVVLSNWFIDQFEVSTSEKRRIEKELTETSEAYRQEEWANTTVKVLPSDTLVVRVRPFLEGWVPMQAVRQVLAEVLGERGEGIDFERVQEFPLGREERKLEVKTHGDESRTGYGRYRSASHSSPFSSGVGGGFWYRWERFLPEDDQQALTQRGDRFELTPRGKVEFELNLDSERELLDFLNSHWGALLALEKRALETGRDADGVFYARMKGVDELTPTDLEGLGSPEFIQQLFYDWSDELVEMVSRLHNDSVSDEMRALLFYVRDLSVWGRPPPNIRGVEIEKASEGWYINLRQRSDHLESTGPLQELPAPYRRFVKTAD